MATRSFTCINPQCPVGVSFTSVGGLLTTGMKDLRSQWFALRDAPPVDVPLCTHDRARGRTDSASRAGLLSDLIQAEFPVPGWVWARRKTGIERDLTTGMPLDVEPPKSPLLRLFPLYDELRYIVIPMGDDPEFALPMPQRASLELPHLSALTGLRYGALLQQLDQVPGRITLERTIRFETRQFWRWWQEQYDHSAEKA